MVSIIVPIYNSEKTLKRCIESILVQTYNQLEILLVNDGSTDSSLEICESYRKIDSRIKIISGPNRGVAAARNIGLKNVHGEYILYIDSDDWIEPNMVEVLIKALKEKSADISVCGYDFGDNLCNKYIQNSFNVWSSDKIVEEFLKHQQFRGMLWNKLIKKSLFIGLHFDESMGYGEDAQMVWLLLKRVKTICVSDIVLYHHIPNDYSISSSFSDVKYDAVRLWKQILTDVTHENKSYINDARAAYGVALIVTIWEMAKADYYDKNMIKNLKKELRQNIKCIVFAKWIPLKFKIFGLAACLSYELLIKVCR